MSHTFGAVCEFGTVHQESSPCPEGDCDHGFTYVACPTPERCGGDAKWWHVFGAPVDYTTVGAAPTLVDDDHENAIWMQVSADAAPAVSKEGKTPIEMRPCGLPWLGSFDHAPSQEELDAIVPEAWLEEEEYRREAIGGPE